MHRFVLNCLHGVEALLLRFIPSHQGDMLHESPTSEVAVNMFDGNSTPLETEEVNMLHGNSPLVAEEEERCTIKPFHRKMMHGSSTDHLEVEESMFHGKSSREMEEEAKKIFTEWREEEGEKMSYMKARHTREMAKLALSRVREKLKALMSTTQDQEPAGGGGVLVGVDQEKVQRILNALIHVQDNHGFTKELMDISYDLEDLIYDLLLREAAKQTRRNWERCFLSIRIHNKLEMIKSKTPIHQKSIKSKTPRLRRIVLHSGEFSTYIEEKEWPPAMFSTPRKYLETRAVSSLIEKLSALLELKSLHPDTKKKTRRVVHELEPLLSFLKRLELIDLSDHEAIVWKQKLLDASHSALLAIEDFNRSLEPGKRSWEITSFGKLKSQNLSKEMDEFYAKVQNLYISRPRREYYQEFDLTSLNDHKPIIREPDFHSFSDDVHAMTTRLLTADKSFRVIPIMGMQGIGKTTLAKLVFNNKVVVDHFPSRSWLPSATIGGSARQILLHIIKQLMNYEAEVMEGVDEIDDMIRKLKDFFTENRSLIVMDDDDPHNLSFMDDLLKALADSSNGSRMIWISRKMSIPPELKMISATIDPHPLRLRTDLESWALFAHALDALKVRIPSEMEKLEKRIVRTCGGLPLLIVKLAATVSVSDKDSTMEDWSSALQHLFHDRDKVWSTTLCRVYKDLSLSMRTCLFSLTLFPRDYEIPTRRLITMWVAEDYSLLQKDDHTSSDHNEARPEDAAERCLNLLIAHGMVQVATKKLNGNVKTVRLPDAMYWLSKPQLANSLGDRDHHHIHTCSELFPAKGNNNMNIHRLVDHLDPNDITIHHIHDGYKTTSASLRQHYQEVISFRSFDSKRTSDPVEYIGDFIRRCISSKCLLLLQVLDLENVYSPKLPETLGQLTQLRYLGLRSTFLLKLPSSIRKLRNLQALDIKHTSIRVLPDTIWELQQLRHLYLDWGSHRELKPQPRLGCLTTLETLCGLFVDEKSPVRDGLNRFLNLRKLGLTIVSQVEVVTEWILCLKHLRSLRLSVTSIYEDKMFDLDLKPLTGLMNLSCIYLSGRLRNLSIESLFPPSLIDLTLSWSELREDPMQSLDKLPNLTSLKLYAKSYIGKSMLCTRGGFPQLRVLKLWKLDHVEEWKVEKGALQALRDLEVRYSGSRMEPEIPEELSCRSPHLKIVIFAP